MHVLHYFIFDAIIYKSCYPTTLTIFPRFTCKIDQSLTMFVLSIAYHHMIDWNIDCDILANKYAHDCRLFFCVVQGRTSVENLWPLPCVWRIFNCCIGKFIRSCLVNSWKYIGFYNTMETCSCWFLLGK